MVRFTGSPGFSALTLSNSSDTSCVTTSGPAWENVRIRDSGPCHVHGGGTISRIGGISSNVPTFKHEQLVIGLWSFGQTTSNARHTPASKQ
jgi:hypothetical protein